MRVSQRGEHTDVVGGDIGCTNTRCPAHAAHDIIVFADFTNLVAYGKTGLKWRTKRVMWDDDRFTEVTRNLMKGEFWELVSERTATFVVDLATGAHAG